MDPTDPIYSVYTICYGGLMEDAGFDDYDEANAEFERQVAANAACSWCRTYLLDTVEQIVKRER